MSKQNNQSTEDFLNLINSLIEDRMANLDRVELCQVVSNDDGSGTYNLKLVSDDNTVVEGVVNSSPFSYSIGDYVYVLKVQNKMSNAFIIGTNKAKMNNKK